MPNLPLPLQILRVVAFLAIAALLSYFLLFGTVESRVLYLLAFILGLAHPVWGLYGLGLMAPMFLLDASKSHLLAGLEVFLLGIFAGELRLLARPIVGMDALGGVDRRMSLGPGEPRVYWGLWPYWLITLGVLLLASSLVSLQLIAYSPLPAERLTDHRWIEAFFGMWYFSATEPEWALRSLWNWGSGMLLAVVLARRVTPLVIARWLKIAGLSLAFACLLGLLDHLGILRLTHLRRPNLDPLHAGRLQGTAGHGGWFAQWIVFGWAGLLLWWDGGRRKRQAALAGLLAVVGLALLLTAARAAWVGVGVAAVFGAVVVFRRDTNARRIVLAAIPAVLLVALAGSFLGGEALQHRLANLLRAADRANYYATGLYFLREHPFGLGLGSHYQWYDWWITPFDRWAQSDHVTAHSLWLHTLIENGPFVPLVVLAGMGGLVMELRRSWPALDPPTRSVTLVLAMALLGLAVISLAQYIAYIRIVEISFWAGAGLLVGLCRKVRSRSDDPPESAWGPRLLLAGGVAALVTASMNAGRTIPGAVPYDYERGTDGALTFWTGRHWQTRVNRDIETIRFSLHAKEWPAPAADTAHIPGLPVHVTVTWPDGTREAHRLEPGEWRYLEFKREPREPAWHAPAEHLRITAIPTFTPAEYDPDSTDRRALGVKVWELWMDSEQRRERGEPILKY